MTRERLLRVCLVASLTAMLWLLVLRIWPHRDTPNREARYLDVISGRR